MMSAPATLSHFVLAVRELALHSGCFMSFIFSLKWSPHLHHASWDPSSSSVPGARLLGFDPQLWFLLVMSPSTSQSLHFLIWKMVRLFYVPHGVLMRIKRACPHETLKEYVAHIKCSKQLAAMAGFCLRSYPPHSLWAQKPCLSPLRLCTGRLFHICRMNEEKNVHPGILLQLKS